MLQLNDNKTLSRLLENSLYIQRVSYISDGKILNATLWLRDVDNGFNKTLISDTNCSDSHNPCINRINFGMFVDVNPNSSMETRKIAYHKEIVYPSRALYDLPTNIRLKSNYSWIEDIHETLSTGYHRYLKALERNYTDVLSQERNFMGDKVAYYIPLSLNLSDITVV